MDHLEIRVGYYDLIEGIDEWVEEYCEEFLANANLKYEQWQDTWKFHGLSEGLELVLSNYYKQLGAWPGAKQHILNALIIRYLFDYILNGYFPSWLSYKNQNLLHTIEENMQGGIQGRCQIVIEANGLLVNIDLYRIHSWRRDTMLSIISASTFTEIRAQSEIQLANSLYNVIRNALPNGQEIRFVDSIRIKIIKPSVELA